MGILHAQEYGVLPVLYASTWLLTAFSCPFSTAFAGRIIDIMLLEQRTHILLRTALAVLSDCEADLMQLNDFEELITYLKVLGRAPSRPLPWNPSLAFAGPGLTGFGSGNLPTYQQQQQQLPS